MGSHPHYLGPIGEEAAGKQAPMRRSSMPVADALGSPVPNATVDRQLTRQQTLRDPGTVYSESGSDSDGWDLEENLGVSQFEAHKLLTRAQTLGALQGFSSTQVWCASRLVVSCARSIRVRAAC